MVLCAGDHRFADDAIVSFSEVQGMTELNSIGPVKITNLSDSERAFVTAAAPPRLRLSWNNSPSSPTGPYSFSIGDTSAFSEYECGGVATETKQPFKFVRKGTFPAEFTPPPRPSFIDQRMI